MHITVGTREVGFIKEKIGNPDEAVDTGILSDVIKTCWVG